MQSIFVLISSHLCVCVCVCVFLGEREGGEGFSTSYGFITNCSQADFLIIMKLRAHVADSIFTYRNVAGIDVVIVVA